MSSGKIVAREHSLDHVTISSTVIRAARPGFRPGSEIRNPVLRGAQAFIRRSRARWAGMTPVCDRKADGSVYTCRDGRGHRPRITSVLTRTVGPRRGG
jgi:hypothetical protein